MMKGNMKWLLLIPVFALALALGYLVPTQLLNQDSGENQSAGNSQVSQAAQVEIEDIQSRIADYQTVLSRTPGDIDVVRVLADAYYELGTMQGQNGDINESYRSYKNAVDQYLKYLAVKPDNVEVMTDLGLSYGDLQMTEIAIRELKAAIALAPDNQRAWHSLGWVQYNGASNLSEAKIAWQKSYDLDPNTPIGKESKSFLDEFSGQQSLASPSVSP